jgi:hypothetical protein
MMAIYKLPDAEEKTSIPTYELPICGLHENHDTVLQIALHLRNVLALNGTGCPLKIQLPPALELSGFYRKTVMEVLDALFELKREGYDYHMYGLDGEITLIDPLSRKSGSTAPQTQWGKLPTHRTSE